MSGADTVGWMIFGFGLLVIVVFYYAATDNIRQHQRKKRAEANGGEDYVSTAWVGKKEF